MKLMSKSSIICFVMMYQRLLKEICVTGYYNIVNKKDRTCIQVGLVIYIYKITITVYNHGKLFLILPI